MGNEQSTSSKSRRSSKKHHKETEKSALGEIQASLQNGMRKFEDSTLLDAMCGNIMDDHEKGRRSHSYAYSEEYSEEDSRTLSVDDTLDEYDRRRKSGKKDAQSESESLVSDYDTHSEASGKRKSSRRHRSQDSESGYSEDSSYVVKKSGKGSVVTETAPDTGLSKPLASSFAKRCYFTKAGIGMTTQHYEGLTLTGNVVLMLASAMKLKGCPTICDEDLRRVEQTYPNQFSRLPDELLLSSGWRRISKYCHFSNKPIPDGVPFFHSKQRIHPSGGYYFLLAAAVGMIRPMEVEPLTRDTLVLLETDYPTQCDAAPEVLIQDPSQWTLVDKFCFFSGGPINTEEDVYYQADFDGNLIFMLAFLSPSLTPEELYKLGPAYQDEPGLKTVKEVEEVESVYDLTERDFDDLKLYHLGPCRALPPYILQPQAWTKVLPPHFLAAKQQALMKAHDYEEAHGIASPSVSSSMAAGATISSNMAAIGSVDTQQLQPPQGAQNPYNFDGQQMSPVPENPEHYHPGYAPSTGSYTDPNAPGSQYTDPNAPGSYTDPNAPGSQYADSNAPSSQYADSNAPASQYADPNAPGSQYADPNAPQQMRKGYYPQESAPPPPSSNASYGPPQQYPQEQQRMTNAIPPQNFTYSPAPRSDVYSAASAPRSEPYTEESFQREMEEEGAFIDSSAPIDEAIASRQMHRVANYHYPREPGTAAISPPGYLAGSEPGISQIDPPAGEPPSLMKRDDVPDDEEGGYREEFVESTTQSDYSSGQGDQHHYDSRGGAPNGHGNSDHYYYDSASGDREEEEYYDSSPEKGNLRVHAALKQQGEYGRDAGRQFIYSAESESEGGYHRDEFHDDSPENAWDTGDRGDNAGYYDDSSPDAQRLNGEPEFSSSEDRPFESEDPALPEEPSDYGKMHTDRGTDAENKLISPRSDAPSIQSTSNKSEYSQTSAMRGAQELLKKNRQKRLEMAMRKHKEVSEGGDEIMGHDENHHHEEDESADTSMVSGSSVWTDTSATQDRSSRRALILQMAKARMKSNKQGNTDTKMPAPIAEADEATATTSDKTKASTMSTSIDLVADLD